MVDLYPLSTSSESDCSDHDLSRKIAKIHSRVDVWLPNLDIEWDWQTNRKPENTMLSAAALKSLEAEKSLIRVLTKKTKML